MPTFTVHEHPRPPADRIERAERLVFVKEGFSWRAAVLAPLWLLAYRLWLPLLAYIVIAAALQMLPRFAAVDPGWAGLGMLALHLIIGLEADTLRRWRLGRRGFATVGTVSGRSTPECERRFFEAWLPEQPILAPRSELTGSDRGVWRRLGGLAGAAP